IRASIFATIAMIAAPALPQNQSPYETREQKVEAVQAISVEGAFKVSVFGGSDTAEVILFGPAELLADAKAEIEDETLVIKFREGAVWSWNPGSGMHAVVKLPQVHSIAQSGPGHITARGIKGETVTLGVGGAGRVEATGIEANTIEIGVGGSGTVAAEGSAGVASFGVGGSGQIEAKRLRVQTADIGVGGSGQIYADVSEKAKVGVNGSGRVEVVGGGQCEFDPAEASKIECR
ncbi:MAG: DUF2807 domain-containing protein, partial [Pseudomonadota bacterium]